MGSSLIDNKRDRSEVRDLAANEFCCAIALALKILGLSEQLRVHQSANQWADLSDELVETMHR